MVETDHGHLPTRRRQGRKGFFCDRGRHDCANVCAEKRNKLCALCAFVSDCAVTIYSSLETLPSSLSSQRRAFCAVSSPAGSVSITSLKALRAAAASSSFATYPRR